MTWEMAFVLGLMVLALLAFVWEKYPADIVALGVFSILLLSGVLPREKVLGVFANPAPITVAAMFVLSSALVRCGAIDWLSGAFTRLSVLPYPVVILLLVAVVAFISAWINNTPVVVVFVPIVLRMVQRMGLPASKFLIPLSYAAVLGGCCTLIGTSTNLVVNGILLERGLPGLEMFELASLGLPAALIGAVYLAVFGRRLLPAREMLSSILTEEERREYLTEAFVPAGSPLIGRTLKSAGLVKPRGFRVMEIVRDGVALPTDLATTPLEAGDRLVVACRPSGIARARSTPGFDFTAEAGLEQIAAHESVIFEGAIAPNSELIGQTLGAIQFRQRYRAVILAVHRGGVNIRERLNDQPLAMGDILLLLGTEQAMNGIRQGQDIILFDRPPLPSLSQHRRIPIVVGAIAAVVGLETAGLVPIEVGAISASVLLCMTGCLRPKDAYQAIEWNLLFVIFGMLALGAALQHTGAADWIAHHVVAIAGQMVSGPAKPLIMLACVYLITSTLTEVLSNNAIAAIMAPIAIGIAAESGLDARPFIIAVTFAASAAFATPIGYQTNTYVYGIGGYRFTDFVRIGVPLNILCFLVAMYVIPRVWHF